VVLVSWIKLSKELFDKASVGFVNRATLKFLKGEDLEPAENKAVEIFGRKTDFETAYEKVIKLMKKEAAFSTFVHKDKNPLAGTLKKRVIHAPNEAMRAIQSEFILFLRNLRVEMPYATGAVPGGSPMENVKRHQKNSLFYLLDIHNFYPSFKGEKLAPVICSLSPLLSKQEKSFLRFLKRYCLDSNGGLLIGSIVSPDLANLYASVVLDKPLGKLADKHELTYTRYLDDLAFSCSFRVRHEPINTCAESTRQKPRRNKIGKEKKMAIRNIVLGTGFSISHHKSHCYDLFIKPVKITGIMLGMGDALRGGIIFLPRDYLRKIRMSIRLALQGKFDPAKIHGMMGVFHSSTDKSRPMNKTELNLVGQYKNFCKIMKQN
jgi:hypothetical protein